MKRELHFEGLFRQLVVLGIILFTSVNSALAGEKSYYDYYANLKAYPTGAGQVYADATGNITENQEGVPFSENMGTPADEVEVKYMAEYNSAGFNAYAVPATGWIFAGFSACKKDAAEEHLFNDSIFSRDNPAYIKVSSHISNEDQGTAEMLFPLVADTTFYALFTHVAVNVCTGQDSLGTTKISTLCNNINDKVTLTATPRDASHTKFDYWIKRETGEKIDDNPLTLTVKECAHYEAHFTSDLAETLNFPEEGGMMIYHSNYDINIPRNVKVLTFNYLLDDDSVEYNKNKNVFYQVPDTAGYFGYANETYIMLGKGEATFFKTGKDGNAFSNSYFKWSNEGVNVANLAAACHYYTINLDKQQFELLADNAIIPANTAYWALPNERYEVFDVTEAPAVIYWNDPDASTGIANIKQNVAEIAPKGIYNILGQKVAKMTGKGLYIVNGKKVINLAK